MTSDKKMVKDGSVSQTFSCYFCQQNQEFQPLVMDLTAVSLKRVKSYLKRTVLERLHDFME